MSGYYSLLLVALVVTAAGGQRGCPTQGCDPRGLNCQPDFTIQGTKATIGWTLDLGSNISLDVQKSIGCVGNDMNIICRAGDKDSRGFVSVNGKTGSVNWHDTLMSNPRLPIMDLNGDIIATDGRFMEFRLKNGSLGGKPAHFLGYINNCSSIQYVEDPNLFFFVSYESGGVYMYDSSGMCVASAFLDVKDPTTNRTVAVWIPLSRLIVNTEMDPPCTYFIAQHNVTKAYRIYAVNFNHQPPYLSIKWAINIEVDPFYSTRYDVAASRLIVRGDTLLVSVTNSRLGTWVIRDDETSGVLQTTLNVQTQSFASYDLPTVSSKWRDDPPLFWLNTFDNQLQTVLYGWTDGGYKYSININQMFNTTVLDPRSELMIFGYRPDNTTLVFGYFVTDLGTKGEPMQGGYITAVNPLPDGTVKVVWSLFLGKNKVAMGQIIGHQENILVATVYDQISGVYSLMGIQLQ